MEKIDVMKEYYDAMTNGRIVPYYQPVISLKQKRIVSAEALCRMILPDGMVLSPEGFIPVLERTGEICSLDWYMAEKACETALKLGFYFLEDIRISVNLSRRHVNEWDAVEKLSSIVDSYGLEHSLIEVEITESYKTQDVLVNYMIDRLIEKGFSVAIDDFGKGESTVDFMKKANFNTLKVDKSLISGNVGLNMLISIINNLNRISRKHGTRIIYEGVETPAQENFLLFHDCDLIQGNYNYPPMPENELINAIIEEKECKML